MRNNRPCFVWRFVSGQNATYTTTAASEREARSRLPAGRLVFAARIRVNGGGNMHNFKPLGSLSQSDIVNTLYFDENASAATLLNTVIGRLEGVMRLHDEIAMLPPDAGIDGKALSTVSKTLLSDAYSLLLAVQSHAERYGDARELIKQHAITYSALAGLIRKQNQPQEEEGRV